jgi:choline dehydrogenase-like flavoprotein
MRTQFDYIIVGAGSAGCIVASRLSEDPRLRVLLVEAGGSDRSLIISMPAALPFVYQSKKIGWGYLSGPEPHLGGRTIDEKMGRVIGGSSSINAMIYNRGNPMDYDGWAAAGLPKWDYAHCLPYFRKMETWALGASVWRGGDGPLQISRCRANHKLYDAFLRGGEQAGFALTPDHNGYKQEGPHVAQAFIYKGLRWSSARAYLSPAIGRVKLGAEWIVRKKGLGTSNFFETGAFLRTRDDVAFPNMQYEFLPLARQLINGKLVPIPGFQFWMDLSRPQSRGEVTLRSANPADPPSIIFHHLEARQDMLDLVDGVRLARTMIRQPAWDTYRGQELRPGPDVISDSEIETFLRQRTSTSYHPSGTCLMGADAEAVVDTEARVKSVHRMRIIDASIMPRVVTGNLNAPVMMMAEKISDRILGKPSLPPSNAPYYRAAH